MEDKLIGQTIEGYLVGPNIAAGGMGRIYQALDTKRDTTVAIKILLPEYARDENFQTRFWREAELMSTLRHPHIVPVYTYGEWGDYLYIVMQLVRGPSLEHILQRRQFSPLTAWQIVRPVTEALGFGHRYGVLHRDLKTGNILIERRGEGNYVFLTDFGLGKRPDFDTTLTAAGVSVGTPEYMAPEVAMGQPSDHRADLYSMGVVLYELLLGRLPFHDKSPQMTALAHVDKSVPRPRTIHTRFPRSLEALLLRALEKDPRLRFQSAVEMQQAYYESVKALEPAACRACYWIPLHANN
ncbi:serine/threonine protein kinase [Aggregatilinea lenta]|uniref:serine/threonine protein kinase n=1 Tax=Aggregatilinea lenta TaxID=913108 RepID=UPI000E5A3DE6|nr:serine/threonine-protein kinase [Aggregatilinea lenta]